jgi:hypothetical protein
VLNCSGPEDARHNPRDAPEASASKRELARSRMQSVGIGASGTVSSMLEVVIPSSLTVGALACWLVCAIAQRESPLQPQVRHRGTKCPSRSSERETGLPDSPGRGVHHRAWHCLHPYALPTLAARSPLTFHRALSQRASGLLRFQNPAYFSH